MPNPIKLYFVEKFTEGDKDQQLDAMRQYFTFVELDQADAIFCASVVSMEKAIMAHNETKKPLAIYCWDYYLFAHDGRHTGWNWKRYAELMAQADIIFVPSQAQQLRLKELLGLDSVAVKTGILTYEHEITDAGFILDPLRYYPDEQAKWPEQAAKELGIPIIHSEHQYSQEEFRKLVASCTFMTCAVPEASTGGLTLSEGLWLGKPSLISNSPFQGANDYLESWAYYFQYDDYQDFKNKMKEMWENKPKPTDINFLRESMRESFSFDKMAKELYENIKNTLSYK